MSRYFVEQSGDGSGPLREIEAANWMMAVSEAMEALAFSPDEASRIVCDIEQDGTVHVREPGTGRHVVVRQAVFEPDSAPVRIAASGDDHLGDPGLAAEAPEPRESPAFQARELTDADMDRLSALAHRVTGAGDAAAAAQVALDILLQFVPAESASVLLRDTHARTLRFVAARGPRAEALHGVQMPENAGIAGLVVRSGSSMLVREAQSAPHHYRAMDAATGYHTRSLLAVPLRTVRGVAGVVELLNPFGAVEFAEWHQDAAYLVAGRLAQAISARPPA